MRNAIRFVVLGGIVGYLFFTNPSREDFEVYVQERVEERLREDTNDRTLGRLLTDLGSSVVGSLAARVSERNEYYLFSVYTVDVGADGDPDEDWRFLGIAGRFVELSSPETE